MKSSNRKRAPQVAAFVDEIREVFCEIGFIYAGEGDLEIGRFDPEGRIGEWMTAETNKIFGR